MSVSAVSSGPALLSTSSSFLPPPKQIRFVTTDGQPHTKRRRINAACLTCRKRKTRCSGERPNCKTCTDNAHVCAGYADRQQQGSDDALEDEIEHKVNSRSSSPKAKSDQPAASSTLQSSPTLDKQIPANFTLPVNSQSREEWGGFRSPASNHTANSGTTSSTRHIVPYFRYFGPTAIVPGFKQMVVAVKDHRRSTQPLTGDSPASGPPFEPASGSGPDPLLGAELPFYDATDPSPNAPLVTHLCEMFFTHLGCNYPFLQRERFMRDLEEKHVDAILVDAVCGVAARFSSDPILTTAADDDSIPREADSKEVRRAFRGHAYAQRAMSAVIDTFPCPTIAVAQACLLLAYEEFGTDHDSGLWMYLGTSIRMAQDLGIQKLEGLQLEGRIGPTPKTAKSGQEGKDEENRRAQQQKSLSEDHALTEPKELEDRRASEQERIDTFWAIFFLDRAVSSGVGRPVTLRDKDIEISFPYRPDETMINGYPHPFPPMIRIVHMYGRVADVLNHIKDLSQVTPDVLKKLASMEKDLTTIYQRLSPKLHFNATNFQHYVKAEQGTNFILLHFWFHTLIILLHQPTLLHSFEGRIQQLFPDSRELSMSSAKTIADILAFAELIDVKSFIGNPFTSQPMYVAACAFLAEAAAHGSRPASRAPSPPESRETLESPEQKSAEAQRHTLLASAANQNYQRCYKALQILDSYWAGCRYILTALDQKAKGLMDPLLFTADDVDGPMPSTEPSFTTPGWRRSIAHSVSMGGPPLNHLRATQYVGRSPTRWSQAIGWSLSGTTNSPQPNLSFLYPGGSSSTESMAKLNGKMEQFTNETQDIKQANQVLAPPAATAPLDPTQGSHQYASNTTMIPPPPRPKQSSLPYDPVSTAEADLLLSLNSPYAPSSANPPAPSLQPTSNVSAPHQTQPFGYSDSTQVPSANYLQQAFADSQNANFSDMMIESQEIDMTAANGSFTFPRGDMVPWLEYLPQDVLNYFGDSQGQSNGMPLDPDSDPMRGDHPG